MEDLSVAGLCEVLKEQGISVKTLDNLSSNMVSGLALTLLDDSELKELVPVIGDRAILRNFIKKGLKNISSVAKAYDDKIVCGILDSSASSSELSVSSITPENLISLSDCLSDDLNKYGLSTNECEDMLEELEDQRMDDFQLGSYSLRENDDKEMLPLKRMKAARTPESPLPTNNELSNSPSEVEKDVCEIVLPLKCVKTMSDITPPRFSARKPEPPLPTPFEVPTNFPPMVMAALSSKSLYGKPRTKFITTIAQAIHRYKSYPTANEIEHVVRQIHAKLPFLHMDDCNTSKAFQVAIKMRMAYLRKPEDCKRSDSTMKQSTPRRKTITPKPKQPSLPIEHPGLSLVGEDKKSVLRHLAALKAQLKKVVPNNEIVKELMKRTYEIRRQEILDGNATIKDILSNYVALQSPLEIFSEFDRIFQKKQTTICRGKWRSLVPKLLLIDEQDGSKGIENFNVEDDTNDESRSIMALASLYFSLPDVRVKKDLTKIMTLVEVGMNVEHVVAEISTPQPCLIVRQSCGKVKDSFLVIERQIISKVQTIDAAIVLFATFYVFNVHFPDGCANVFGALETMLLDRPVNGRKPRISAYLNRLNRI